MSDDNLFERLNDLSIGTGSRTPLAAIKRIEELEAKLATAEWLLVEASVQLRDGKMKTRRNRADLIDQFLTELKGEKT